MVIKAENGAEDEGVCGPPGPAAHCLGSAPCRMPRACDRPFGVATIGHRSMVARGRPLGRSVLRRRRISRPEPAVH